MTKVSFFILVFAMLPRAFGGEAVQIVPRDSFSSTILAAVQKTYEKSIEIDDKGGLFFSRYSCPDEAGKIKDLFYRIVQSSGLSALFYLSAPLKLSVHCEDIVPLAQMRGGLLIINTVMLKKLNSQDELAWIISHELSHLILAHMEITYTLANENGLLGELQDAFTSDKAFSNKLSDLLSPLALKQEYEADIFALSLEKNAGLNPELSMQTLLDLKSDILADKFHPAIMDRIDNLNRYLNMTKAEKF